MRPRKIVLLIDGNEQRLGERRFLIDNWGFRPIGSSNFAGGKVFLEDQALAIDLVVLQCPADPAAAAAISRSASRRAIYLLLLAERASDVPDLPLDRRLVGLEATSAAIREEIKNLTARKRGPRPQLKKPPASVPAEAVAELAGVAE